MSSNIILGFGDSGNCPKCSDEELFSIAKLNQFTPSNLGDFLRLGLSSRYLEYQDHKSSLMIPGPMNRSSVAWGLIGGSVNWNLVKKMADKPPVAVTQSGGGDDGVPGSGGGGGSTSSSSQYYAGIATCERQYESRDNCYACCDTLGWSAFLGMGITAGAAAAAKCGAAVAAPTGFFGTPFAAAICGLVVVVIVGAGAYTIVERCKDACERRRMALS